MSRPSNRVRRAQAALLGVMVSLIVGIILAMALDKGPPDDWGVDWQRPAGMRVDNVELDAAGGAFIVTLHLWDEAGRATEWDGALTLQLADENDIGVYNGARAVRAEDFTTTRTGDVVDTCYILRVPFSAMEHVTPRMIARPATELSIKATFTTDGRTLTSSIRWWLEPTSISVARVAVDEELEMVFVDVVLLDERGWSTKRNGELGLIIVDSTGYEMYVGSAPIEAGEFNLFAFAGTGWAWYPTWVEFKDMRPSKDRLEAADGNGPGRCMTVHAWFRFDGSMVEERADGGTAPAPPQRIPDALLLGNEPPRPRLDATPWGLAGRQKSFDASGTSDDLGSAGLRYEWSWGDGSTRELTDLPYANHTFARAGTYTVELRVTDVEGASASVNVTVDVLRDPRVDPRDVGDHGPGDRAGETLVSVAIATRDASMMLDVVPRQMARGGGKPLTADQVMLKQGHGGGVPMDARQGTGVATAGSSDPAAERSARSAYGVPQQDSMSDPKGRLEVDLTESWERYKGTAVGMLPLFTMDLSLFIIAVIFYEGSSSDEFDELDLLLGALWSVAVVLVAYLLMLMTAWARRGPSPAVYESGVLLVRTEAIRLGTFSYSYAYKDLEAPHRTLFGLRVRSKDGQSWKLRRDVFGEEWLRKIEERILYAPTGTEPPRLVLYPKADGRLHPR